MIPIRLGGSGGDYLVNGTGICPYRVDAASMTTLNHTLALAALTFATFVVCPLLL